MAHGIAYGIALLTINKSILDMPSVAIDGSHTLALAKKGGACIGYQRHKKAKTTNMLFLVDRQGMTLACSETVSGNNNDLFEIEKNVFKIIQTLKDSNIEYRGLFMNADAGFDSQNLRRFCEQFQIIANFDLNKRNAKYSNQNDYYFDSQLYKERFVIERTNAWIDGFKSLIIRYETKAINWLALYYIAFAIMLLTKAQKSTK